MNENIRPVYGHIAYGLQPLGSWANIADQMGMVNKCLVVDTENRENLFKVGKIFQKVFGDTVEVLHTSAMLVEVMPKGINKLKGLKKLCQKLDIPLSKVMTFGDYDNDVEMLSAAGLGVAVSNASTRAKEASDLIIGSVEEQGPARFLAKLLDRLSA